MLARAKFDNKVSHYVCTSSNCKKVQTLWGSWHFWDELCHFTPRLEEMDDFSPGRESCPITQYRTVGLFPDDPNLILVTVRSPVLGDPIIRIRLWVQNIGFLKASSAARTIATLKMSLNPTWYFGIKNCNKKFEQVSLRQKCGALFR